MKTPVIDKILNELKNGQWNNDLRLSVRCGIPRWKVKAILNFLADFGIVNKRYQEYMDNIEVKANEHVCAFIKEIQKEEKHE